GRRRSRGARGLAVPPTPPSPRHGRLWQPGSGWRFLFCPRERRRPRRLSLVFVRPAHPAPTEIGYSPIRNRGGLEHERRAAAAERHELGDLLRALGARVDLPD